MVIREQTYAWMDSQIDDGSGKLTDIHITDRGTIDVRRDGHTNRQIESNIDRRTKRWETGRRGDRPMGGVGMKGWTDGRINGQTDS